MYTIQQFRSSCALPLASVYIFEERDVSAVSNPFQELKGRACGFCTEMVVFEGGNGEIVCKVSRLSTCCSELRTPSFRL